jgi:S-adenosylmethionine:tRNA ribosyltransferase-isomerase
VSRKPELPAADALRTSAYDYPLPHELIAHYPAAARDESRLLVVRRDDSAFEHRIFRDIVDLFTPGDVLVLNDTRVIPARLLGRRAGGGEAEIVLLHPASQHPEPLENRAPKPTPPEQPHPSPSPPPSPSPKNEWVALVRPGSKLRPGRTVEISPELTVEIRETLEDGSRIVRLHTPLNVRAALERYGRMPLPPYIERDVEPSDRERYQTVYARVEGSVAAPTAGLHVTPALLDSLRARGVHIARALLHVGVGTFRPVEVEDPAAHVMHAEWYAVTAEEAERMNVARRAGHRLWALGTTVTRTVETVADEHGIIQAGSGWTRLFIRPGYSFRAVDRLITNFHLPRSTLLMLVCAFGGYDRIMAAYRQAVAHRYRFYSYGDAMVVL